MKSPLATTVRALCENNDTLERAGRLIFECPSAVRRSEVQGSSVELRKGPKEPLGPIVTKISTHDASLSRIKTGHSLLPAFTYGRCELLFVRDPTERALVYSYTSL